MQAVQLIRQSWERERAQWAIAVACLAVFLGLRALFPFPPGVPVVTGDEPHYLLIAHTFLHETDLNFSSNLLGNYVSSAYAPFYPAGGLGTTERFIQYKGRLIMDHPLIGVPLMILPAYALGGRIGVVIFLSVLAALGMASLYGTCTAFLPKGSAALAILFLACTYPLVVYSQQVFPDSIAIAVIAVILGITLRSHGEHEAWEALGVGFLLGLLLHMHQKFVVLAAPLWILYIWHGGPAWRQRAIFSLAVFAVMMALLAAWVYFLFGDLSVLDISRALVSGAFWDSNSSGLQAYVGLLFDREFGLLMYSPFLLLAGFGIWSLLRRGALRADTLAMLAMAGIYYLYIGAFRLWDGGYAPAGRSIMPLLPFFVIWTAAGLAEHVRERWWIPPVLLGAGNVVVLLALLSNRTFVYTGEPRVNAILRDYLHVPWLMQWLPAFRFQNSPEDYLHLGILLAAVAVAWGMGIFLSSRFDMRAKVRAAGE